MAAARREPKAAQISTSALLLTFGVATGLKLLLIPAYHSTDFEVHRNWLAITGTLPVSRWYLEDTSEWTLDYPPFFAWFEWLLAQGAPLFDPGMLTLSATPYVSTATVLYQRLTVIGTDALLFIGAHRLGLAEDGGAGGGAVAALALCCLDAGLLLVDHVHFQYNGMMVGLLLLSVAELRAGHAVRGAVLFAVLLQLKHLFLFAAPLYVVFLLRRSDLPPSCRPPAALLPPCSPRLGGIGMRRPRPDSGLGVGSAPTLSSPVMPSYRLTVSLSSCRAASSSHRPVGSAAMARLWRVCSSSACPSPQSSRSRSGPSPTTASSACSPRAFSPSAAASPTPTGRPTRGPSTPPPTRSLG